MSTFLCVSPPLLAATWNVIDAFQVYCCVACFGLGVFFPFLDLPLLITSSSAIHIFSLASHSTGKHLCFHLCALCSCETPMHVLCLALTNAHGCAIWWWIYNWCYLQMPISLPIVWGSQESWNNPIGYKANCWWFTFHCVRLLMYLSFSISVGNRIQFADILKGVWSISSAEIVWALSFETYCYLSLSVAETVLWGYNRISISKMHGFAFCFIFSMGFT